MQKVIFRTVWQIVMISVTASMLGFLTNQIRTDRIPLVANWSPEARLATESGESLVISLEEARALCLDKGAVFLDARSEEDYSRGHVQCAQNIPWQSFEKYMDRIWGVIPEEAVIVTYCDGEHCALSEDLAKELIAMGYKNVKVLLNGWTRWSEAGLPVAEGDDVPSDSGKV